MIYQPVVGLEIHIELNTKSKMFCGCKNNPDEIKPNINVCPVCLGHPGTLPVINEEAVRKVIKTALALNCKINEYSYFERKNYFYPDLPKGFQISQYKEPLAVTGYLEIPKKVRITRVHLEEDTGKLIHQNDFSLIDFNRAGIPLMELVTEPDINSALEAKEFIKELQLILKYLGVSEANMEKGEMRAEVNISLLPQNQKLKSKNQKLGTKVEIKNLNSIKAVEKAIEYEIGRQTKLLKSKKGIIQETRGWDDKEEITLSQREKEEAYDYRYFPEPDLPPLKLSKIFLDKIKAEIPELPCQKRERFSREYQLDEKNIGVFTFNKDLGGFFEKVISEFGPQLSKEKLLKLIRLATNYIITDLQGLLQKIPVTSKEFLITPENFAEFIILIEEGKISSKAAKILLKEMFEKGSDPSQIIEEKGLKQVSDETEIEKVVKEIISKNQKAVEDYKSGKEGVLQFLIGKIMAETRGTANPGKVKEILKKIL